MRSAGPRGRNRCCGAPFDPRSTVGGFTVLEALVTLLIVSLAVLLAGRLFLEAQARMADALHEALVEPGPAVGLRQLRADLRLAKGVRRQRLASTDALLLRGHPAGELGYVLVGEELLRRRGPTSILGGEAGRPVLRRVRRFSWRRLPGQPAVELELGFMVERRTGLRGRAGLTLRLPTYQEERLVVVLRGGPRGEW